MIKTSSQGARHEIKRTTRVQMGMSGPIHLFAGQLGDWTWEAVGSLCDTDVLSARNAAGAPAYLAFYYVRVHGGIRLHPGSLFPGDRITVTSRCYGQGPDSVLTLHRIDRDGQPDAERPLDPAELYEQPRDDSLYVETFNHWVSRSTPGSNEELVKSSPPGFRNDALPRLPAAYDLRAMFLQARVKHTFRASEEPGYRALPDRVEFAYPVDIVRDLNGVGLLYFASYFALVDKAALALWRQQGRSDRSFLRRTVLDRQISYLRNADLNSVLVLSACARVSVTDPGEEIIDVVIRDRGSSRVLAVSTLHTVHDPMEGP